MNHKVLLADDSLTIQKVIKITLASQPYDIVECSTDDELFKKLSEVQPKLVFLDFNLSEKYTGYELTTRIKSAVPSTKVILLLGTFDSVDDAAMQKCGASDKIVKPFDSNKFIAICNGLVDSSDSSELPFPKTEVKNELPSAIPAAIEDQWQVGHTVASIEVPEVIPDKKSFDVRQHLNPLDQEITDWGMSVPGVIDDNSPKDKVIDLPPVIGDVKDLSEHRATKVAATKSDPKYPENEDLDYPTIEQLNSTASEKSNPNLKIEPSKFLSIEPFNHEDLEFEVEHQINTLDEANVSSIEAQIRDEVENDLWQVDEFEDLKKEVSSKIDQARASFEPSLSSFNEEQLKALDQAEADAASNSVEWSQSNFLKGEATGEFSLPSMTNTELKKEIEALVKKHVKIYLDEMFKKNVEKVTWEVIPDLAENIIRQELSKISNKILND